jgi:20S proteasome alpha/beta subunit
MRSCIHQLVRSQPIRCRPQPTRFYVRRLMTVAVGFVCEGGVVLAADTKESFDGDIHTYVHKIARLDMGDSCQAGITGSGRWCPEPS